MAPDDFKNLGLVFKEDQERTKAPAALNMPETSQGTTKET
jgi:hypothetical protein